jgi:hypothetical protein
MQIRRATYVRLRNDLDRRVLRQKFDERFGDERVFRDQEKPYARTSAIAQGNTLHPEASAEV